MSIAALPLWLKLACCGVLIVCIALAYLGPPPTTPAARRTISALLLGSLGAYATAVAALLAHRAAWAAALVGLAVLCGSLTTWMSRFGGDEGPKRAPAPPPPDDPLLGDWERFERAFRRYAERRDRELV
ncbi:MAG TPA: hypothetical protein VHE14_05245 [Solirubrobacteraceae bacterium]|nr:hypothetical protein [Solirubrobacteraceae bacterium]